MDKNLVATPDEEDQQTVTATVTETLLRLEAELRKLKDKTETDIKATNEYIQQQSHSNGMSNKLIQSSIQNLETDVQELQDARAELQLDITQLRQQFQQQQQQATSAATGNGNPTANTSSPLGIHVPSIFQRNVTNNSLPSDTFTLMMTSPLLSQAWLLGLLTFAFQMVLIFMIGSDQIQESVKSSDFNVPFKVDTIVRAGQLFTIVFALATQNDITTSVRFLVMFWKDPHWHRTVLKREEGSPPPTTTEWVIHILLSNILKLIQGLLVMLITFVVIVQSDNIIDLLKDFTALMVLSETDNIFFSLAANGYLGSELQMKTIDARDIQIVDEASTRDVTSSSASSNKDFLIRPIILLIITTAMIGGWLSIVINQLNGKYFRQRYSECNMTGAFELAKEHFGNEFCYGGPLNTLACEFEGGDCINFNLAFPLCKGDDRTQVEELVGNGFCDPLFRNADCDFDGGDCCPYEIINDPSFGDGVCDARMNTEGCGYDNGDCLEYNRDFKGCPLDVVFDNPLFGDGQCNGGIISTEVCRYDNGDCNDFYLAYPDCPLENIAQIEGADEVVIGDGLCNSGIFNTEECGYMFGDCNRGQLGQTVVIPDDVKNIRDLYFSKSMSLDGSTMAFGLWATREDGSWDFNSPGFVKVLRYDITRKMWLQLGGNIIGDVIAFGYGTSLSSSGNHIAIFSRSAVRVFQLNTTSNDGWSQVGQKITSDMGDANGVLSANAQRLAFIRPKESIQIFIYHLEPSSSTGQRWVNGAQNIINPGIGDGQSVSKIQLKFNSLDASRLLINTESTTKVFQMNSNSTHKSWIPLGQKITSPFTTSSAISADGSRIAVPSNSTTADAPGQVSIFDYDAEQKKWITVGDPIISGTSSSGDGFGYGTTMSSDGKILVIGSNTPSCGENNRNQFDTEVCKKGSIELYNYHSEVHQFKEVIPHSSFQAANGNVLNLASFSFGTSIFGLHFSLSGNGSVLSMSGFNVDEQNTFAQVYNLNDLFYTKCAVSDPDWVNDGYCDDRPPFNTNDCGFDGGDCTLKPVDGYPDCFVNIPGLIGNGACSDYPPYNTEDCGFDGGDCTLKEVERFPGCYVYNPDNIGDGWCDEFELPYYNTEACGFDGGDCL